MPKRKTKKGAVKRFKVTSTGKVLHGRQNNSHKKSKRSKSRLRRGKEPQVLATQFAKKIKIMLGE